MAPITPIKVDKLAYWLTGYDKSETTFLLDGFTHGFTIPFNGSRSFRSANNLKSVRENPKIVYDKISDAIVKGHVAGPFLSPPFPNFQISPIGLVPKKDFGKFRLIHHLSFGNELSVNAGIPDDLCTVNYQTIDDAIALVKQCGYMSYMTKVDIENAYKIVPIHPHDFELLGFSIDDKYFFDKTLPMGLSYSCALFERLSTAFHWTAVNKLKLPFCAHILDDFFFVNFTSDLSMKGLNIFLAWAQSIGLPINPDKTVTPCTTITFVGIELDSIAMEARLPLEKLQKIRSVLHSMRFRKKVTLQELQSVIGLLNFACRVVRPGRAFLRRLIDLTVGLTKPHFKRRLTLEARADLAAWSVFMDHFNGKSMFLEEQIHTSLSLHLYTDASNLGFGGYLQEKWFSGKWPQSHNQYHITVKEFLPIVIAVELFSELLANKCVTFHSDNAAVVAIINKQSSKDKLLMKLVRRLVIATLKHNILFKACHIPGLSNNLADSLSRLQVEQFLQECPFHHPLQMAVPPSSVTL